MGQDCIKSDKSVEWLHVQKNSGIVMLNMHAMPCHADCLASYHEIVGTCSSVSHIALAHVPNCLTDLCNYAMHAALIHNLPCTCVAESIVVKRKGVDGLLTIQHQDFNPTILPSFHQVIHCPCITYTFVLCMVC